MRIYLPRFFTRDLAGNLAGLRDCCQEAAGLAAEALFFPELFLTGYYGEADPPAVRAAFAGCSALSPQMLCFFGTLSEEGYNRQLVYLAGREVARYEKVHLFEPNGEQELSRPGQPLRRAGARRLAHRALHVQRRAFPGAGPRTEAAL